MVLISRGMDRWRNIPLSLILFLLACSSPRQHDGVSLISEHEHATGISIPRRLVSSVSGSIEKAVHVRLTNGTGGHILGSYTDDGDAIIFKPLIPFTNGLTYEVVSVDSVIAKIKIPIPASSERPQVLDVFPSLDTLPNNLLKVYLKFSQPMREGHSLEHIAIVKNNRDTLAGVFLEIHPELWNNDQTILTLWLDPGRIKRDLQPNLRLGEPLSRSDHYSLLIRSDWASIAGLPLSNAYRKDFVAGNRDEVSPVVERWKILAPKSGTIDPLMIYLNEPLDRILLEECMAIKNNQGNHFAGTLKVKRGETVIIFTPDVPWYKGSFILEVESRLEDLAGNNLNRLFDRDVTKPAKHPQQAVFIRKFDVP